MTKHLDMMILGDGIAGRAMALAFAQNGIASTIIAPPETSQQPQPLKGGIQLAPNGWVALKTLGLDDKAQSRAQPLTMMRLLSAQSGNTLVEIDLTKPSRRPYASLPRQALADLLLEAAKKTKLVKWKSGSGTALATHDDHMALTLSGKKAPLTARFMVGADGAHGLARSFVIAEDKLSLRPAPRLAFRTTIPLSDLPSYFAAKSTSVWLGDGAHMVFYPLKADPLQSEMLNLVIVTTAGTSALRQAKALIKAQPHLSPLAAYLETAAQIPLHRHPKLDVLRRGRILLAGDAAHPMPPHLAQGAGQSLVDAASLKTALTSNNNPGQDLSALFTTWGASRLKAVNLVQEKADRAGRIFALDGPLTHLRNFGLSTLGGIAMERELDRIWQS